MSLKILNFSNRLEGVSKTIQELGSNDMSEKSNENITNANVETSQDENKEYFEINILSFKKSFTRLQKNYSLDN